MCVAFSSFYVVQFAFVDLRCCTHICVASAFIEGEEETTTREDAFYY
jgi:hypothetical protein